MILYDRIQRARMPWSRWASETPEMRIRLFKVVSIVVAALATLVFLLMLLAFVAEDSRAGN